METVGHYNVRKIIELKNKIANLYEEIEEMECSLAGAEINHPDYAYCIIDYIDDYTAFLYCEDEDGKSYNVQVNLEKLLELLK